MRDFRKYEVWHEAINLAKQLRPFLLKLPEEEKYAMISQIRRSSVSIASNIAEGSSRESEREFKRFIEIALGSAFELETQLILAIHFNYLDHEELTSIFKMLEILQKKLNALRNKLK